ncbi:MAG: hypothetical protein CR988_03785 [Treponema sp.]|nr:MAG: hypothetical protein CR988_03785 [Treponema sp.]
MIKNKIRSILFILQKMNHAGTKGKSSITNIFSVLGIAFGVMVLIVILSVMNGFQMGFINTILEVTSGHAQLHGDEKTLLLAEKAKKTQAFFIFTESQALLQGKKKQSGCLIRAVNIKQFNKDTGLFERLHFMSGNYSIDKPDTIIIGYDLARTLRVSVGDSVYLPVVSGGADTDIFPENSILKVTGIFKTGYLAVDSTYAFISLETGMRIFGKKDNLNALVKLKNKNNDEIYINEIKQKIPELKAESWRKYNHAFFGALKIEKNVMLLLIVLIFLVVAVNIYNGMRRSIYDKREDIAVLTSLGMKQNTIQLLFISNGFLIGLTGAVTGLILGLLISININEIFSLTEKIVNSFLAFMQTLVYSNTKNTDFSIFSPKYFYIEKIPTDMKFGEVLSIFLFGILSSSFAAFFASIRILKLKPAEVLRYE